MKKKFKYIIVVILILFFFFPKEISKNLGIIYEDSHSKNEEYKKCKCFGFNDKIMCFGILYSCEKYILHTDYF